MCSCLWIGNFSAVDAMVAFERDQRFASKFMSISDIEEAWDCVHDLRRDSISYVALVFWLCADCDFCCCSLEREFVMRAYR